MPPQAHLFRRGCGLPPKDRAEPEEGSKAPRQPSRPFLDDVELTRGQMLDVERFPDSAALRALATADELEEYTYLVAGSVGAFWTEVCVDELGEEVFAEERETMIARGVAYGKGLQLVNVLRDVAQDAQLGRCYLPTEELGGEAGLGQRLESGYGEVAECFARWMGCCSERLEHGVGYLEAITPWRLKYATALPLLFAGSTLARLREADWEKRKEGIKISRREVKSVMARAAAAALRRGGIESLYRRLSRG
ncbi:MAG: phytoene/squalene synthase family protein [Verrucomicrobiales bacterium]